MKVTFIPIVIGALSTVTEGFLKELEDLEVGGRVETIQTTALLRSNRILGDLGRLGTRGLGSWRTSGDHPNNSIVEIKQNTWRLGETCCHSDSSGKPSVNAGVKNSLGVDNNNNDNNNKKKKGGGRRLEELEISGRITALLKSLGDLKILAVIKTPV